MVADELYKPLMDTMFALRKKTTKQAHYDYGMRAQRSILRSAGALVRSGVEPADAIYSSFYANQYSSMAKVDMEIYKEVLNANFPGAKQVDMD